MTTRRLHEIAVGPTVLTGDGTTTFTLAQASLADLTAGMVNGDVGLFSVVISVFNDYQYSITQTLSVHFKWETGPVYTLDTNISITTVNQGSTGSPINSGLTLDVNSGNLRVRAVLGNGTGSPTMKCYAVFNTLCPFGL